MPKGAPRPVRGDKRPVENERSPYCGFDKKCERPARTLRASALGTVSPPYQHVMNKHIQHANRANAHTSHETPHKARYFEIWVSPRLSMLANLCGARMVSTSLFELCAYAAAHLSPL